MSLPKDEIYPQGITALVIKAVLMALQVRKIKFIWRIWFKFFFENNLIHQQEVVKATFSCSVWSIYGLEAKRQLSFASVEYIAISIVIAKRQDDDTFL
jgi:ABC-type amino acid transport substrate-binding protein